MDHDERLHHRVITATFDSYALNAHSANSRRRTDFLRLSAAQQQLLPSYLPLLRQVDDAIIQNQRFLSEVVSRNPFASEGQDEEEEEEQGLSAPAPTREEHDKMRSTLRQCVRDWSDEGAPERQEVYTPMVEALIKHCPALDGGGQGSKTVLVPGAGLGRLAFDLARSGYTCQANEFSLFMLITSNFLINHTFAPREHVLHPYIHSFSNHRSATSLLRPISIPDVLPSTLTETTGQLSYAAGDFLEVYTEQAAWDAVATCFFLDTAKNIVDYLEKIWDILKDGAIWVNCGPSLWHWENSDDKGSGSIELTMEDVKALVRRIGFEILEERELETTYTSDRQSCLVHTYTATFWVVRKAGKGPIEHCE